VTAAGFVPIGFAKSSAGEYTFSIFAVVSMALIVSWFVAVLFAPLLGVALLSKPKMTGSGKRNVIPSAFRRLLVCVMRARWVTIGATLACFVAALLASPYVPRQFFPSSDRPELLVDLRLPQNASIYASETLAARLDFAAPFASYPNPTLLGLYAMMRPEKYQEQTGLYMLEPYDPDQIPVVFVHGLLSIPQMWVPTISAIQSDPELHGRFQFWVFAYPTGDPITVSALRLRKSLQRIYQLYPRTKGMVLITHSMDGFSGTPCFKMMRIISTRQRHRTV